MLDTIPEPLYMKLVILSDYFMSIVVQTGMII